MAVTTINAVMQMRRGLENDLDVSKLQVGEWALSTDSKFVRICYAPNKVIQIASQETMDATLAEIEQILEVIEGYRDDVAADKDDVIIYKNSASASATQASQSATSASNSAITASSKATLAESWAVGGTGTRTGEDTNNAKYWAEHSNIPAGGTTGQVLAKASNADRDMEWVNQSGGGSTVSWSQILATGTKIAEITINGTTTEIYAPSGGGGGGMSAHFVIISDAESTVSVIYPDGTTTATVVQTASDTWECDVLEYGTYTIHAVLNGDDAVIQQVVDAVKIYTLHDEHFYQTINVYAPVGSSILVTGGTESYTGTGAGSTATPIIVHSASTTYTVRVTVDGVSKTDIITSGSTSGGSQSVTIAFGTINLTYDTDFQGVTITCAQGSTTITKIAPSSGTTMAFYPPVTGTWTISATVSGSAYSTTAEVVSLDTAVSATLMSTPEGSTVLPTDDVQILLNCAHIWDKSYTTLSELLADSTTLQAVINSTNAIDYLVRSKMFAKSEALVPTMTSDNTPSGICIASTALSGYNAYKAFDGDNTSAWIPNNNATNNYVGYEFTSAQRVEKATATILRGNWAVGGSVPSRTFKVQGYSDNWHDIGTITTEATPTTITDNYTATITTSGLYTKCRLFCEDITHSDNQYDVRIMELQFYKVGFTDNATAMSYIGLNNYASNTLLADETWCEAICNSTYFESVLNVKVPTMTSNTTPSGEVSAQSYYSGREPYLAFDGNSSTRWNGSTIVSAGQSISEWIKYKFTQRVSIKRLSYNYNSANTTLIIIEGSNDNSTFREVARCSNVSQGGYTYVFTNPDDYQYYRLTQTQTNNTTGSAALPTAVEIQLYGRADI